MRLHHCFAAAVTVFALVIAAARAHDTWLLPEHMAVELNTDLRLDLTSGMDFPTLDHAIKPDRVQSAGCRLAGKTNGKLPVAAAEKSLRFHTRLTEPGVATLWVTLKPRPIELTEKQVAEYLDEIGASEAIRKVWTDAGKDRHWREVYTKHAKTFVRVGKPRDDTSWSDPVGTALEITPLKDPTGLRVGDSLPVRVVKDGKPLAAFVLNAQHGGKHAGKPQATDADGRAAVVLTDSGLWLLAGTDLRRAAGDDGSWVSDFATVTFEVRQK
jgi:uncharacterized GH25 family protein